MILKILCTFTLLMFVARSKRLSDSEKRALEETKKCRQAESVKVHPLDCCKYPRFYDNNPELMRYCSNTCRLLPYPLFVCQRNCIIEYYKVLDRESGGIFNPKNRIVTAFWDQDEIPGVRQLTQDWYFMVINSTIRCYVEFPETPGVLNQRNVSSEESWNYYYSNYVECIRKFNFIGCKMINSSDCEKLKEAVTHCYVENYSFLHNLFFEDFYYRNKSEEKRIEELKNKKKIDLYYVSVKMDDVPTTKAEEISTAAGTTEKDDMYDSDEKESENGSEGMKTTKDDGDK